MSAAIVFLVITLLAHQAQALIDFPETTMYVDTYAGGNCNTPGVFQATAAQPKGCSKWLLLPARDVNNQCETKNVQFVSRPRTLLTPKCDGVKESNCFQSGAATYVSCCAPLRDFKLVLNPGPSCPFTYSPTALPTIEPTVKPTKEPTMDPTKRPTADPTTNPTKAPTEAPTVKPTKEPTMDPTKRPTADPTKNPTKTPTEAPTKDPYCVPSIVGLPQAECNKKIKRCGAKSPMRWVGTSCSGGYYAGCQCQQYCAFNCKAKCTSSINKKFCKWEDGVCKNKATGEVGVPITQC